LASILSALDTPAKMAHVPGKKHRIICASILNYDLRLQKENKKKGCTEIRCMYYRGKMKFVAVNVTG